MNYHAFPSQRPVEDALDVVIATALDERYTTRPTTTDMIAICRTTPGGIHTDTVCHLPRIYARPVLQLLFRRYALALLLHYNDELVIEPNLRWITFAQNFLYLDVVWNGLQDDCAKQSSIGPAKISKMGPSWRSTEFDRYIATEVVVGRHEPIYVNYYRRQRAPHLPNISQISIEALGVCSVVCIRLLNMLTKYRLGPV